MNAGDTGEACAAALAFVEHELERSAIHKYAIVFSTDDVNFLAESVEEEPLEWEREGDVISNEIIPGPPKSLLRRLAAAGGRSAIAHCPSVTALLKARGIAFGPDAVAAAMDVEGETYRASIQSVSLPVVARSGNEAVLESSGLAGSFGGGGELHYLKRDERGVWRVIGGAGLWVS